MSLYLDEPAEPIATLGFRVAGWVACDDPEAPIAVTVNDRRMAHMLHPRPDVVRAFPEVRFVRGVVAQGDARLLDGAADVEIALACGAERIARRVPLAPELHASAAAERMLRAEARAWCLERLRCPVCAAPRGRLEIGAAQIVCDACATVFPQGPGAIDMLTPALRARASAVATENVSANPYETWAQLLINETTARGGWVLDCGAGSRPERARHVVNVEIVDYPATDVLAAGEALPFADGVFDGVVSLAVLEHVRDPFACARELLRVAKPGATLVVSVPFLQPVHGYPGHYYNMTQQGLLNLFGEAAEVVECAVPPNGHPILGLQWLAREYLEGLPEPARSRLAAMRLDEVAAMAPLAALADPVARDLPQSAQGVIACLNSARLRKRG
ncbi:MAG TPA: class I SAM-dependent methyltransferase [Acetobacteraceae bacterium]|nr:class I SAM-dependent methyltransferase [Acetobacteraceae bacterium]